MIADDTATHYLPERETVHLGRDGASGNWEPWMEQRAERLYRMRALNQRTHHGPTGDVLRLFLFLADGWGWQYVKRTCIKGHQVTVRGCTRGVANRVRGEKLTPGNLWKYVDDIAEDQYRPELPNQAQIDRVGMSVSMLGFGVATGKMGTIERFIDDLMPPDTDQNELRELKTLSPLLWTMVGASNREAMEILEGEVDQTVAERAALKLRRWIWLSRSGFRRKFTGRENGRRFPTNPLSFFGAAAHFRFKEAFRRMPIRCTPAQMLGGHIAHMIVLVHREDVLDRFAGSITTWLPFWLQSDACKQWLAQMEREVTQ